jgi:DNA primase
MRIPDEKIEEVRAAADIVDVISGFVRLKKSGRGFMGLCPFHQEKTPSFHVHPEKDLYKCFGCGKGGNVFTFLMEMERTSFVETVTLLAERYSISLPTARKEDTQTAERRDALLQVSRTAARFFYDALQGEKGEFCRTYLKKRAWTDQIQRRFGLGYAPDSWDALLKELKKAGIPDDILEEAGLIIKKESGKTYDRFRNRLMFPIFSVGGKVVGFGARALNPEDQPKYLNSPETAIYNKSKILYGLSFAVPYIRERDSVVLVEGYADVIALHQAGFGHVVATSGTALTTAQIQLLMRYTPNVLFLYDADSAGANAMLRSIDIFLDEGIIPGIINLPQGEDPDSFIKSEGAAEFGKRLAHPQSFVDFITARYKNEGKLDTPEGKTEAVRHIVSLLAKITDRIKQDFYLHHIADKYEIYETLLYTELQKHSSQKKKAKPLQAEPIEKVDDTDFEDMPALEIQLPKVEREFMSALLGASNDIISETLNGIHITDFQHKGVQHILLALLEQKEDHGSIKVGEISSAFNDNLDVQALLADLMIVENRESDGWKDIQTVNETDTRQVLLDAYRMIINTQIIERIRMIELRMSRVKGDGDQENELARQKLELEVAKMKTEQAMAFSELPAFED